MFGATEKDREKGCMKSGKNEREREETKIASYCKGQRRFASMASFYFERGSQLHLQPLNAQFQARPAPKFKYK